jgi:hypothetical protein
MQQGTSRLRWNQGITATTTCADCLFGFKFTLLRVQTQLVDVSGAPCLVKSLNTGSVGGHSTAFV